MEADSLPDLRLCGRAGAAFAVRAPYTARTRLFVVRACVCERMREWRVSPARQSWRSELRQLDLIAVPQTNCEGSSCSSPPQVSVRGCCRRDKRG